MRAPENNRPWLAVQRGKSRGVFDVRGDCEIAKQRLRPDSKTFQGGDMHPICLIRTLWRSFYCGAWVMGHDYKTDEEPTPPNVHVVRCMTCGDVHVSWSWGSIEHIK